MGIIKYYRELFSKPVIWAWPKDSLTANGDRIGKLAREIFKYKRLKSTDADDSFSSGIQRLQINDLELLHIQDTLLFQSCLFACFAVLITCYTAYCLYVGSSWRFTMISFGLTSLVWSFAFQRHFWFVYFKNKKNNMSLQDYIELGFFQVLMKRKRK